MVDRLAVSWLDALQDPKKLSPEREQTRALLAQRDIELTHYIVRDDAMMQADLTILGQTVSVDGLPENAPVLGLRTLNRKTRLDALRDAGLPVQPFGAPNDNAQFAELLAQWDAEFGVVKLDWSFRRAGVVPLPTRHGQTPRLPLEFDPSKDVVMQPVTGDPRTLKVDLFAGHVLGGSWLDTRQIGTPNWQMIGEREQWPATLEDDVRAMLAQASEALLAYGCGYASLDVMFDQDGPKIIEANTTSVGTSFWRNHPEPYAQNLAEAIAACVQRRGDLPKVRDIEALARANRNEEEAASLAPNPDRLTPPDNLDMHMDAMMREADELSEGDRRALGAMVETDLVDHARLTVPAYLAEPQMLGQVIDADTHIARPLDFISRHWPNGHGMLSYAISPDLSAGHANLRTFFSRHVEAATHRRALRWLGVKDPGREIELIDRAHAEQNGLGSDSPPHHIIAALDGAGPISIWTKADTALALARAIPEFSPEKLDIRGIVLCGSPLSRSDGQRIMDAIGAPVAEMLYAPPAGSIAIRCPDLGLYHVLSDVGRIEVDQSRGDADNNGALIMTGFYNFAHPMIRVRTGQEGCFVTNVPRCNCPISSEQMLSLL